ncbi:hypothetical protein [Flavobacterium reichenbachii]|uniref:hypothetical protein n=1 Tax=Flavobacterium reichenbachii TaxID=362418 RepID=UPI000691BFB5|nr:hypothetical protein [Flavobacterium reichenbachii]OXB17970.1 hypothetical protein B0A68_03275 [Flavobacterium reichenbachii]
MKKIKLELFTSELLVLGIIVLLLNDFYLKYEFHNVITGKLSDFAGLFVFPFFVSIFLPKHSLRIYIVTALFFIFWKLEISNNFIAFISEVSNLAFYRTVDISDLIAISILPFSYKYFEKKQAESKKSYFMLNAIIGIFCFFTLLADSQPRLQINIKVKSDKIYKLPISKNALYNKWNKSVVGAPYTESHSFINFTFYINDYNTYATAITTIKEDSHKNTIIKLDSITDLTIRGRLFLGIKNSDIVNAQNLSKKQLELLFQQNCVNKLIKNTNEERSSYDVYPRY